MCHGEKVPVSGESEFSGFAWEECRGFRSVVTTISIDVGDNSRKMPINMDGWCLWRRLT